MENQHKLIKGFRDLSQAEIDGMNLIKVKAEEVRLVLDQIAQIPGIDGRALAIAKTELQTGFMWAVRSIAQPTTF